MHLPAHHYLLHSKYTNSQSVTATPAYQLVMGEFDKWAAVGVKGHFTGDIPWATCEDLLPELCKDIVGVGPGLPSTTLVLP